MTDLLPYDLARAALAEARSVDDVKDILDKAAAMAEYRRRAGDRSLEVDAIEIRMFAERRLGQMIAAQKETVGLNKGALRRGTAEEPRDERPTLADSGIDKKLSAKAQKMAAIPPEQFSAKLSAWREEALTSDRVITNLLQVGRTEEQRENRTNLAATLSDKSHELTGTRQFPCIYADPPWSRKAGIGGRAYENHYPTMTWDEIMALPVKDRTLPDAWLFLWLPRAHVLALHPTDYSITVGTEKYTVFVKTPLAYAIARAWGFDSYSTMAVWTKTDEEHPDDHGTGLIFRDQDEILCLFKKGKGLPMPLPANKFGSNHRERSKPLGHSRKPQFYRDMIAKMTNGLPVLELFSRFDADHPLPENWEGWGNESTPGTGSESASGLAQYDTSMPARKLSVEIEIPQEASGTSRKDPSGSESTEPSLHSPEIATVAVKQPVMTAPETDSGEAEPSSRLHSSSDHADESRWHDDGGPAAADEDLLVVKPLRAGLR